jgi:hypothetical protein
MKEIQMETQLDYFDNWANAQKAFMGNLLNAQKEVRSQWLDSVQKVQDSIGKLPGVQDNPQAREALNLYNTWFSTMLNTTKALGDEALKVQETLNASIEKQIDMGRELAGSLSELSKPAKKK